VNLSAPHAIETIAVIGATEKGRALAEAALRAGYSVVLEDVVDSRLHAVADSLRTLQPNISSRLILATTVENAVRHAAFIIEAVADELEMKLELFTIFDKFARPNAVLASTTESLRIDDLAAMTVCRERCIGFRLAPAGEIILTSAAKTSPDTVAACAAVAHRMGRLVRHSRDSSDQTVPQRDSATPGV
jgi:3-hydroxyacyl-CoA dehydrogenase